MPLYPVWNQDACSEQHACFNQYLEASFKAVKDVLISCLVLLSTVGPLLGALKHGEPHQRPATIYAAGFCSTWSQRMCFEDLDCVIKV